MDTRIFEPTPWRFFYDTPESEQLFVMTSGRFEKDKKGKKLEVKILLTLVPVKWQYHEILWQFFLSH